MTVLTVSKKEYREAKKGKIILVCPICKSKEIILTPAIYDEEQFECQKCGHDFKFEIKK